MASADKLSQRQADILDYIKDFVRQHGYSPSIRDIQTNLKISSTSVVAYNLKALQEKGRLDREGKISRGIRLAEEAFNLLPMGYQVPLLGTITAGSPLLMPEDTSTQDRDMVDVPADMAESIKKLDDVYALRVRGQSMIDALIDDGDIVLLRYQSTAENGQMVAARLMEDDSVTLKKFYHEGARVRLQPANSTMDPIYTTHDNVQIQGRVVGVIRMLV
ncbi:MAG: transcriptional repressor LexA [Chloroflexaceae bacterium]|nr:transcriptional repressor LexA [Chloroflexaceae bacterium]